MAINTILLRDIVESPVDLNLREYPIFDENYRDRLNSKILDHYLMREIAHETVELFVWRLNVKMNEIMPYYNQLYEAVAKGADLDPFNTYDMATTGSAKTASDGSSTNEASSLSKGSATSGSTSRSESSEHPYDYGADPNGLYATSVNVGETTGHNASNDESQTRSGMVQQAKQASSSDSRTTGRQMSYVDIAPRLLRSFYNIDMMVVSELEGLFFQLDTDLSFLFPPKNTFPYGFNPIYGGGWWF